MHSFTTERLLIRPLLAEDKNLFVSLYTDAKVMRNISEPLSISKAEKAFINTLKIMKQDKPTGLTWVIVNKADNKAIGIQAFVFLPINKQGVLPTSNIAEIGIMLLRSSNGRLLPEEAIKGLIEYGFKFLGLERIDARFSSKNLATARVSKKSGFIFNFKVTDEYTTQIIESIYIKSWQQGYQKLINN